MIVLDEEKKRGGLKRLSAEELEGLLSDHQVARAVRDFLDAAATYADLAEEAWKREEKLGAHAAKNRYSKLDDEALGARFARDKRLLRLGAEAEEARRAQDAARVRLDNVVGRSKAIAICRLHPDRVRAALPALPPKEAPMIAPIEKPKNGKAATPSVPAPETGYEVARPKCLEPDCPRERSGMGLCTKHYMRARKLVEDGKTTWEELVAQGKALPRRRTRQTRDRGSPPEAAAAPAGAPAREPASTSNPGPVALGMEGVASSRFSEKPPPPPPRVPSQASPDLELAAIASCLVALERLDAPTRARAIRYLEMRLGAGATA